MRTLLSFVNAVLVWLSLSLSAFATSVAPKPLSDQIDRAAIIVVGRVDEVTAHGRFGWRLSDPKTRTGPGLSNELRLHVSLDSTRILKGAISPGVRVVLPLWKMWHYDLEGAREAYGKKDFVFFLSSDLRPADEAVFFHFDSELSAIRAEIAKSKRPTKAPEPRPTSGSSLTLGKR